MTCEWVRAALRRHDPTTELADAVVGHLDACPACRAVLDEQFPPAAVPTARPRSTGAGSLPGPLLALAVAAATLLVLRAAPPEPEPADTRLAMLDVSDVCVVVWEPPECEDI